MVNLMNEFIAEVIGLPMDGLKYSKKTTISNATFKKFPKREVKE